MLKRCISILLPVVLVSNDLYSSDFNTDKSDFYSIINSLSDWKKKNFCIELDEFGNLKSKINFISNENYGKYLFNRYHFYHYNFPYCCNELNCSIRSYDSFINSPIFNYLFTTHSIYLKTFPTLNEIPERIKRCLRAQAEYEKKIADYETNFINNMEDKSINKNKNENINKITNNIPNEDNKYKTNKIINNIQTGNNKFETNSSNKNDKHKINLTNDIEIEYDKKLNRGNKYNNKFGRNNKFNNKTNYYGNRHNRINYNGPYNNKFPYYNSNTMLYNDNNNLLCNVLDNQINDLQNYIPKNKRVNKNTREINTSKKIVIDNNISNASTVDTKIINTTIDGDYNNISKNKTNTIENNTNTENDNRNINNNKTVIDNKNIVSEENKLSSKDIRKEDIKCDNNLNTVDENNNKSSISIEIVSKNKINHEDNKDNISEKTTDTQERKESDNNSTYDLENINNTESNNINNNLDNKENNNASDNINKEVVEESNANNNENDINSNNTSSNNININNINNNSDNKENNNNVSNDSNKEVAEEYNTNNNENDINNNNINSNNINNNIEDIKDNNLDVEQPKNPPIKKLTLKEMKEKQLEAKRNRKKNKKTVNKNQEKDKVLQNKNIEQNSTDNNKQPTDEENNINKTIMQNTSTEQVDINTNNTEFTQEKEIVISKNTSEEKNTNNNNNQEKSKINEIIDGKNINNIQLNNIQDSNLNKIINNNIQEDNSNNIITIDKTTEDKKLEDNNQDEKQQVNKKKKKKNKTRYKHIKEEEDYKKKQEEIIQKNKLRAEEQKKQQKIAFNKNLLENIETQFQDFSFYISRVEYENNFINKNKVNKLYQGITKHFNEVLLILMNYFNSNLYNKPFEEFTNEDKLIISLSYNIIELQIFNRNEFNGIQQKTSLVNVMMNAGIESCANNDDLTKWISKNVTKEGMNNIELKLFTKFIIYGVYNTLGDEISTYQKKVYEKLYDYFKPIKLYINKYEEIFESFIIQKANNNNLLNDNDREYLIKEYSKYLLPILNGLLHSHKNNHTQLNIYFVDFILNIIMNIKSNQYINKLYDKITAQSSNFIIKNCNKQNIEVMKNINVTELNQEQVDQFFDSIKDETDKSKIKEKIGNCIKNINIYNKKNQIV